VTPASISIRLLMILKSSRIPLCARALNTWGMSRRPVPNWPLWDN
jgi:hypothetical protein